MLSISNCSLRAWRPRRLIPAGAAWLILLAGSQPLPAGEPARLPAAPPPRLPGYHALALPVAPTVINDGDTFEADLDGDGRLEFPRERVRLLFVDTPELGESHKGKDRLHGVPAREFLARALASGPLWLLVPRDRPTGNYGRTLALVWAGGENVNLALIRAGHGYFDTRFRFPPHYRPYAGAEGEAFDARRGIWQRPASRRRYLKRLRRELKTPAGRSNGLYEPSMLGVREAAHARWLGRYVRVEGRARALRVLSKGVRLLELERGGGRPPFPAVIFSRVAERLGSGEWRAGGRFYLEGFVNTYKGKIQLVVHYGRPANRPRRK